MIVSRFHEKNLKCTQGLRNLLKEAYLRNMVRARPLLIIHSDDMEPKKYTLMTWSQKNTNVYQTPLTTLKFQSKLLYMHMRKRSLVTKRKGGACLED